MNRIKIIKIIKIFLFWLLIATFLAIVIAFFISVGVDSSFSLILKKSLIITYIITFLSVILGHLSDYFTGCLSPNKSLAVIMTSVLAAAGIALFFCYKSGILDYGSFKKIVVPALIMAAVFSFLSWKNDENKRINSDIEKETNKKLLFRENGSLVQVSFSNIIYCSSNGRKTIIHTKSHDYETPMLLKEINDMLPCKIFNRIHKQYIVNLNSICRLKYFEGGRYNIYLNNEDETVLPVGIRYTDEIKNLLKM